MATYKELFDLSSSDDLRNKVQVACIIAAETVRAESEAVNNHANRLKWAKAVFENPASMAKTMLWAILAGNSSATVSQIVNASDSAIQTKVTAAIDLFAV